MDDSATTLAETPVTIQVRTNDTDVDSATLTITAITQGAHGSVVINADQTVTYTPAAAWIGPDTFTYGGTQHNTNGTASLTLSHVVYTRSSTGAVRIYVNGTQVATGTLTGNLSSWSNYELALGGELSGTRYWTGDLHLVAIYSRALTAAEVRQNFLAGAN